MKNFSLVLNGILVIAVAVLFYLHFSSHSTPKAEAPSAKPKKDTVALAPVKPSELKASDIVYVNIDSLDAHYQYILDNAKKINSQQGFLENEYQKMTQTFQKDYEDFNKAAQAGVLSGDALEKAKGQLEIQQNAIAEKQNQIRALEAEVQKKQSDMLHRLADFLARYNSVAHYRFILPYSGNLTTVLCARADLDISDDVIKGLNAEYAKTKTGK